MATSHVIRRSCSRKANSPPLCLWILLLRVWSCPRLSTFTRSVGTGTFEPSPQAFGLSSHARKLGDMIWVLLSGTYCLSGLSGHASSHISGFACTYIEILFPFWSKSFRNILLCQSPANITCQHSHGTPAGREWPGSSRKPTFPWVWVDLSGQPEPEPVSSLERGTASCETCHGLIRIH